MATDAEMVLISFDIDSLLCMIPLCREQRSGGPTKGQQEVVFSTEFKVATEVLETL